MDKQYILMCKKAKEIQDLWTPSCGDMVISPDTGTLEIYSQRELENAIYYSNSYIWLPRQDQLQEMIKSNNAYMLTKDFTKWMDDNQDEQWLLSMRFSMEKLWLTFVMKKLYNKEWKWGGKDWTKIR